jgi:alpha-1,2-mannosyltransferase
VPLRRRSLARLRRSPDGRLLACGLAALFVVGAAWAAYTAAHPAAWILYPVDLHVYWNGGLIADHVSPPFDPALTSPLYDWASDTGLRFTYPPFAAVSFAGISYLPWWALPRLSEVVSLVALGAAAWFTAAGLGIAGRRARLGATLLGMAAGLATEPVFRTLYLGQVNIVLMALILGDLASPGAGPRRRHYRGVLTGIAAGIKLTPLVFIGYLLLARQFRAAAMACAGFAATVVVGYVALPGDSVTWWLHGLFLADSRTGFVGWGGNQSLLGLAVRKEGSVLAGGPTWVALAIVVSVIGLLSAARLHRAGHPVPGLLLAALIGLLDSPVSWDHHWVWVMPGMMGAACYAARAWTAGRRARAVGLAAMAAALLLVFFPWPGGLWSVQTTGPGNFTTGLLWAAPSSPVWYYLTGGDQAWFLEYHWRGLQQFAGNAYVASGLAVTAILAVTALRLRAGQPVAGAAPPVPDGGLTGRRSRTVAAPGAATARATGAAAGP